ncbi:MAG: hypothetical protein RLZZ481_3269 [Pseudomonadota bacterium]|jgi:hypothetical protein
MMDQVWCETLAKKVNADDRLVWRGRHLSTSFLLQVDQVDYVIQILAGRIATVKKGPFPIADWVFALRASEAAWLEFLKPLPKPGFHDVMAMLKLKQLKMEGDLYPLMSHLLYFKDVLASVRNCEVAA